MIDMLIQELGDICHQHYRGSVVENGEDLYQYDTEVIWMLNTPEAKQAIANYLMASQSEGKENQ